MDIKQSKSILAKLLATENLSVQHKNIPTAYFDVKNRVLALPTWKEMSTDLYDLLVGHEVGHALYTPASGWHDSVTDQEFGDNFKGFLNVLEDARIEKLIKRRYPGIRKNFFKAYEELHARDLFGVRNRNINNMLLIDRINLHFKVGPFLNVQFKDTEKNLVKEVEALETWDEVVALASRLYKLAEEELKDQDVESELDIDYSVGAVQYNQEPGESEQGDVESDKETNDIGAGADRPIEVVSETDRHFRQNEMELVDEKSRPYEYYNLPDFDSNKFIWDYKHMLKLLEFKDEQEVQRENLVRAFKNKNNKFVNYLVKEFELKRNAAQWLRARTSKTGEIDVKKVFKYNFSEDLFLKVTNLPNGKNHGLLMFYDMSGSMSGYIASVIEQILVLVEFCRKVNIPYEVYGFTNSERYNDNLKNWYDGFEARMPAQELGNITFDDNAFRLQQYFSDQMSGPEYKRMVGNLCLVMKCWNQRFTRSREDYDWEFGGHTPECEQLQSTPLNETIMLSTDIFKRFKQRTKADIVNMVYLTDGEADRSLKVWSEPDPEATWRGNKAGLVSPSLANAIITHNRTKISKQVKKKYTNTLLELVRELTGANIVGFLLCNNIRREVTSQVCGRWVMDPADQEQIEKIMQHTRRDRVAVVTQSGFNEYYIVHHASMNIDDEELDVEAGAEKKDIMRAFRQLHKGKLVNRVLLNRFIGMIA